MTFWGRGKKSQKSQPTLAPASPKPKGRSVAQAPWKQIQTKGRADAENKLGMAGGCDPVPPGQDRDSPGLGHLGLGLRPGLLEIQRKRVESRPLGFRGEKGQSENRQYIHGNVELELGLGHWSCICCFIFCSISCMRLNSSSFILISFSVSASGVGNGRMGMGLSMRLSWVSLLVICWMQCAR